MFLVLLVSFPSLNLRKKIKSILIVLFFSYFSKTKRLSINEYQCHNQQLSEFDHYTNGKKPEIAVWKKRGHCIAINRGFMSSRSAYSAKSSIDVKNYMRLAENKYANFIGIIELRDRSI